jgi:hypothetical protein
MLDATSYLLDSICYLLNTVERWIISFLQSLKSFAKECKQRKQFPSILKFNGLYFALVLCFFPFFLFYWFYVCPFIYFSSKIPIWLRFPLKLIRKNIRLIHFHINNLHEVIKTGESFFSQITSTKLTALIYYYIVTAFEVMMILISR